MSAVSGQKTLGIMEHDKRMCYYMFPFERQGRLQPALGGVAAVTVTVTAAACGPCRLAAHE